MSEVSCVRGASGSFTGFEQLHKEPEEGDCSEEEDVAEEEGEGHWGKVSKGMGLMGWCCWRNKLAGFLASPPVAENAHCPSRPSLQHAAQSGTVREITAISRGAGNSRSVTPVLTQILARLRDRIRARSRVGVPARIILILYYGRATPRREQLWERIHLKDFPTLTLKS